MSTECQPVGETDRNREGSFEADSAQRRLGATRRNGSRSLAMQKVEGSSPFIRSQKAPILTPRASTFLHASQGPVCRMVERGSRAA